ncbi:11434_t:CDS:2 [Gigaspora margarita]|uniref:11434_t:CDS:1 n=1 Tax=Gigaspora margarita TaxID=4874 RepID=A0ABN7VX49_GIGMA|nr:11434_t:CDS:2 [Gigaspora margarita]
MEKTSLIFDLDDIYFESISNLFAYYNVEYSWSIHATQLGLTRQESNKILIKKINESLKNKCINMTKLENIRDQFAPKFSNIKLMPSAREVVESLCEFSMTELFIAMNSTCDEFKKKMSRFEEFVSFFDEIIYGDDIEVMECRNKYQAVMDHMSLSPNECLVIEDSSCGIYKAIEQNLKVIWIQDQKIKEYFDENYKDLYDNKNVYILKSLNEVYIRNLLQ